MSSHELGNVTFPGAGGAGGVGCGAGGVGDGAGGGAGGGAGEGAGVGAGGGTGGVGVGAGESGASHMSKAASCTQELKLICVRKKHSFLTEVTTALQGTTDDAQAAMHATAVIPSSGA